MGSGWSLQCNQQDLARIRGVRLYLSLETFYFDKYQGYNGVYFVRIYISVVALLHSRACLTEIFLHFVCS